MVKYYKVYIEYYYISKESIQFIVKNRTLSNIQAVEPGAAEQFSRWRGSKTDEIKPRVQSQWGAESGNYGSRAVPGKL